MRKGNVMKEFLSTLLIIPLWFVVWLAMSLIFSFFNACFLRGKIRRNKHKQGISLWFSAFKSSFFLALLYAILLSIVAAIIGSGIGDERAGEAAMLLITISFIYGLTAGITFLISIFINVAKNYQYALQSPKLHSINTAILTSYGLWFCFFALASFHSFSFRKPLLYLISFAVVTIVMFVLMHKKSPQVTTVLATSLLFVFTVIIDLFMLQGMPFSLLTLNFASLGFFSCYWTLTP